MDKGVAEGVLMSKFLVLYRSPISAREQMANATPEQAQAGMQAWQAWAEGAGAPIVDLGAPLDGDTDVTGFSVLQADSRGSLDELLADQDHPHRQTPGASIDVLEFMPIPGMEA
jgi:hypothetical protein